MELGAHLPLIPVSGAAPAIRDVREYARAADALGYRWLCANDHLVFRRPWLDGPTALAAVLDASGDMGLATTVCLPAVRGPAPTAKALATLDLLSGGRLAAGLGPGSSERDYEAVGIPGGDRFARFEEAVRALRVLLGRDAGPFAGRFHSTEGLRLDPPPGAGRPEVWMAGWGGARGLRRAAELGDGWIASGYNTTPERFAVSWRRVRDERARRGGDEAGFSNAVATLWTHVTEDRARARRVVEEVLAPMIGRSAEEIEALSLPIGPAEVCAERLAAFADAGAQRLLLWPLGEEVRQLELVRERVAGRIPSRADRDGPGPCRCGASADAGN